MKKIKLVLISLIALAQGAFAQDALKLSTAESVMKIHGTSNIHDWRCKVEKSTGEAKIVKSADGKLEKLVSMNVSMEVNSYKSIEEDGKPYKEDMDEKVYEYLLAKKNPINSITLKNVESINPDGTAVAVVTVNVAGATKDIKVTGKVALTDKGLTISGKHALKMTDFKVDPPSLMFGAIKCKDDISFEFNLLFK